MLATCRSLGISKSDPSALRRSLSEADRCWRGHPHQKHIVIVWEGSLFLECRKATQLADTGLELPHWLGAGALGGGPPGAWGLGEPAGSGLPQDPALSFLTFGSKTPD